MDEGRGLGRASFRSGRGAGVALSAGGSAADGAAGASVEGLGASAEAGGCAARGASGAGGNAASTWTDGAIADSAGVDPRSAHANAPAPIRAAVAVATASTGTRLPLECSPVWYATAP